jgi:6-phosphogluconolactonase
MRSKLLSLRHIAYALVSVGVLVGLGSVQLHATDREGSSFVYVMTNKTPHNSVIQYERNADGSLMWMREVWTGGRGTGPNGPDPLGSQDSLVLSGDGHLLLAANAGSNEISVLKVRNGRLMWSSKVWSGGDFPNSIALSGDLVYVLNAKGAKPRINGFRLDPNGFLHAIPGARMFLPSGSAGANDIHFSEDGTRLLVTVAGTNQLLIFNVDNSGVAGAPTNQTAAGGNPFGIRFGQNDVAVISEAAGSASSYQFNSGGTLDVISGAVANSQAASCWISLTRSGQFAFVSNTGSGTISSYEVGSGGQLSLVAAMAANPGGTPVDSTLSRDSAFYYVMDAAQGMVHIFSVNGSNLTWMSDVSVPAGSQGIAGQ